MSKKEAALNGTVPSNAALSKSLPAKSISKGSTRESSIELLKIFALFMIVLSHVIQTLCQENGSVPYHDYVIDLNQATTDPQQFALSVFRYSGAFGNLIFILSSAWFLVDSDHFSPKKWFSMLTEVWVLSVAVMLFSEIESGGGRKPVVCG